jgi:hypothetical protein
MEQLRLNQGHDACIRTGSPDGGQGFAFQDPRQLTVQKDQVRLAALDLFQQLAGIPYFRDDLPFRLLFEQDSQRSAHPDLIVCQKDIHRISIHQL